MTHLGTFPSTSLFSSQNFPATFRGILSFHTFKVRFRYDLVYQIALSLGLGNRKIKLKSKVASKLPSILVK